MNQMDSGIVRKTASRTAPKKPRTVTLQARWTSGICWTAAITVRWMSPFGSVTLTRFIGSKPIQPHSIA